MSRVVSRLIGVYQADGGLLGELRYLVGRATGRTHCALCEITHAGVRRKAAWQHAVRELGVPVDLLHLNERPEPVRAASAGRTPCVLAQHGGVDDGPAGGGAELTEVLSTAELDRLGGDVTAFVRALAAGLAARGLRLPPADQTSLGRG